MTFMRCESQNQSCLIFEAYNTVSGRYGEFPQEYLNSVRDGYAPFCDNFRGHRIQVFYHRPEKKLEVLHSLEVAAISMLRTEIKVDSPLQSITSYLNAAFEALLIHWSGHSPLQQPSFTTREVPTIPLPPSTVALIGLEDVWSTLRGVLSHVQEGQLRPYYRAQIALALEKADREQRSLLENYVESQICANFLLSRDGRGWLKFYPFESYSLGVTYYQE
jgi:hypothetical protein